MDLIESIGTKENEREMFPLCADGVIEDNHFYWFRPKSKEEVEVLENIFDVYNCLPKEKIANDWVCIESEHSLSEIMDCIEKGVCACTLESYMYLLSSQLDTIKETLETLGYDIKIEKRG